MRNFKIVAALVSIAAVSCGSQNGGGSGGEDENGTGGVQGNPFATGGAPSLPGSGGSTYTPPPANGGSAPSYGGTTSLPSGGGSPSGGGGTTGTPPASGGAPSGGGGTTGTATGGAPGTGGSTYVAPPGSQTATMTMTQFQIEAGQELYMCQNYDNPFGGQDAAVQDDVMDMTKGAHHAHIFYGTNNEPASMRSLESCSGIEFHPLLDATQTPHQETTYPPGMAAKVLGSTGLRLQVHMLNTTTDTLTVNVQAKLTAVDPSSITKWVAEIYYNNLWLSLPPNATTTATTSCAIPASFGQIGLLGAGSHMHSRGTHFVASTSTGVKLYETTDWQEPAPTTYDPPVMMNPGDQLTWSCTYNNTTSSTLTFGEHAATNEMCIFVGRFFSSPSGEDLECQAFTPNGQTGQANVAQ